MKFYELKEDERRDWLNAPATQAFIEHLIGIRGTFQQDALARARKHEPAAYEAGKADGIDDAIEIAKGRL